MRTQGIIARYEQPSKEDGESTMTTNSHDPPSPLSLYLTRNEDIGDAGTAALAAAIRTVSDSASSANSKNRSDDDDDDDHDDSGSTAVVLDVLDLSGCDIGDTGTES